MADSIVECFAGLMGGGKSYCAVERAANHFVKSGRVYTNLELKFDNIKKWAKDSHGIILKDEQYNHLSIDELREFPKHITAGTNQNPVLLIIDEAALFFNAREWAKTSKEILEFLTQTRKVDVNIIFITQSEDDIDKQFRRRIHLRWTFLDLQKFKFWFFRWPRPHMLRTCYHGVGKKVVLKRHLAKKEQRIFDFYSSKQKFTDLHLKEAEGFELEKVNEPTMKKPLISTKAALIIAASVLCGFYLYGKRKKPLQMNSSPITYEVARADPIEYENKTAVDPQPEKVYVTSLQVNGNEYFLRFSNETFLTHLSGVELEYFHHFIVLDGVPFEIDTNYQAPVSIERMSNNYFEN